MSNKYEYISSIRHINEASEIQHVLGGWSNDEKYKITIPGKKSLLLRISQIEEKQEKYREYLLLEQLNSLGFSEYPAPYEFGELKEHNKVYMIIEWMEGDNVELIINKYALHERYELGIKAGKALKKLHTIPGTISAEERKRILLTKLYTRFEECKKRKENIKRFDACVEFINNNLDVFYEREMATLHGDYQGRNIVITPDNRIGVIDFNRICEGDPYNDFDRMMEFTRFFDSSFAVGQIDGYFNGNVPSDFYRSMYFYSTLSAINSLNISILINDTKVIDAMIPALDAILEETNEYKCLFPSWYDKTKKAIAIILRKNQR